MPVRKVVLLMLLLLGVLIILMAGLQYYISWSARGLFFGDIRSVPYKQTALILGARVFPDSTLSNVMADRADAGIMLYRAGKVRKILISGDHGKKNYDEVNTVRRYMLSAGIPAEDIFMDHAGFDTYSSIYRARDIFRVSSLIIVSQEFHLPRALFLARSLGVEAVGLRADKRLYSTNSRRFSAFREIPADLKAFIQAKLLHSRPHFLGDTIPITGDGRQTVDR